MIPTWCFFNGFRYEIPWFCKLVSRNTHHVSSSCGWLRLTEGFWIQYFELVMSQCSWETISWIPLCCWVICPIYPFLLELPPIELSWKQYTSFHSTLGFPSVSSMFLKFSMFHHFPSRFLSTSVDSPLLPLVGKVRRRIRWLRSCGFDHLGTELGSTEFTRGIAGGCRGSVAIGHEEIQDLLVCFMEKNGPKQMYWVHLKKNKIFLNSFLGLDHPFFGDGLETYSSGKVMMFSMLMCRFPVTSTSSCCWYVVWKRRESSCEWHAVWGAVSGQVAKHDSWEHVSAWKSVTTPPSSKYLSILRQARHEQDILKPDVSRFTASMNH